MSGSEEEDCIVVLDSGSGSVKAGFAGDDAPRVWFDTIVGRPDFNGDSAGHDQDTFVGDQVQQRRDVLFLNYPIEHGIVTNWDDLEKIWQHTFDNELRVSSKDQPVLLTESALNPNQNREKMVEVMFETFQTPGTYVALQGILSIYASGRGSAIAVNSGHGVTDILAIYEGYPVPQGVRRINLAGNDVAVYLAKLLRRKGQSFSTANEMDIVRSMKEKVGYTAVDLKEESEKDASVIEQKYTLPDGSDLAVGEERYLCTEILFKPSLYGLSSPGIHELIYDSLMESGADRRRDLFCNICLSGGNTMFSGFQERLNNELREMCPKPAKVKVIAAPERKCSVWIGGSILASLSTFQQCWITKERYEEYGPSIVERYCLQF